MRPGAVDPKFFQGQCRHLLAPTSGVTREVLPRSWVDGTVEALQVPGNREGRSGAARDLWPRKMKTEVRVSPEQEGWYTDPWGDHDARWISDGVPTKLVRDGSFES